MLIFKDPIAEPDYWYTSDDVDQLLKLSLAEDTANIFAAQCPLLVDTPYFQHFHDALVLGIREVLTGRPAIFPINLIEEIVNGPELQKQIKQHVGTHWIALVVLMVNNRLRITLCDPLGNGFVKDKDITHAVNIGSWLEDTPYEKFWQRVAIIQQQIKRVLSELDIADFQMLVTCLKQQFNGADCGAFLIQNSVNLSMGKEIQEEEGQTLRRQHANLRVLVLSAEFQDEEQEEPEYPDMGCLDKLPQDIREQLLPLLEEFKTPSTTFGHFEQKIKRIKINIGGTLRMLGIEKENTVAIIELIKDAEAQFLQKSFVQLLNTQCLKSTLYDITPQSVYTKSMVEKRFTRIAQYTHPDKNQSMTAHRLYQEADRLKNELIKGLELKSGDNDQEQYEYYRTQGDCQYQLGLDYHRAIRGYFTHMKALTRQDIEGSTQRELKEQRLLHAHAAFEAYHEAFIIACRNREYYSVEARITLQNSMAGCLYIIDRLLEAQLYCTGAMYTTGDFIDIYQAMHHQKTINSLLEKIKQRHTEVEQHKRTPANEDSEEENIAPSSQAIMLHPLVLSNQRALTLREREQNQRIINENLRRVMRQIIIPHKTPTTNIIRAQEKAALAQYKAKIKQYHRVTAAVQDFCEGLLGRGGPALIVGGVAGLSLGVLLIIPMGFNFIDKNDREVAIQQAYNVRMDEAQQAFEKQDYAKFIELLRDPIGDHPWQEVLLSFEEGHQHLDLNAIVNRMHSHGFRVDSIAYLLLLIADAFTSRTLKIHHLSSELYFTQDELDNEAIKIYCYLDSNKQLVKWATELDQNILKDTIRREERLDASFLKNLYLQMRIFINRCMQGLPESYIDEAQQLNFRFRLKGLVNTARLNLALIYLLGNEPLSRTNALNLLLKIKRYMAKHVDWLQYNPFAQIMMARIEVIDDLFRAYNINLEFPVAPFLPTLSDKPFIEKLSQQEKLPALEEIDRCILNAKTSQDKSLALSRKGYYYQKLACSLTPSESLITTLRLWQDSANAYRDAISKDSNNEAAHFGYIMALYHMGRFDEILCRLASYESLLSQSPQYNLWQGLAFRRLGYHRPANIIMQQLYPHIKEMENKFPLLKKELILASRLLEPECRVGKKKEEILNYYEGVSFKNDIISTEKHFLLSIDGGGIRGVLPAIWLSEIEKRTHRPIAHIFSHLAGTSTGGIIAGVLSIPSLKNNRMPRYQANHLVKLYTTAGQDIFSQRNSYMPGWVRSLDNFFNPKYNNIPLQKLLTQICGVTKINEALTDLLITSVDETNTYETFTFTRDKARRHPNENYLLSDVLMASSAAPTFFPAYTIGSRRYLDGGVQANNPTLLAYTALKNQANIDEKSVYVVSMGTGEYIPDPVNPYSNRGKLFWAKNLSDVALTHQENTTNNIMKSLIGERYKRWQGLLSKPLPLDAVKDSDIDNLVNTAEIYLEEWQADDNNEWNKQIETLSGNFL